MSARSARQARSRIHVGTSGWMYPDFRPMLYGATPRRAWLAAYAERFNSVEVNASYYRLQAPGTYARWRTATPRGFRFAIKASRYLINRRLREPNEPIRLERERADALGEKLAAVLWQFPARFANDLERLKQFASALGAWSSVPHVVEFRHRSWFVDPVRDCLAEHGISNCLSDAADWPRWDVVTGPVAYVRLHGHTRTYDSSYSTRSLQTWAERAKRWQASGYTVFVYFDNTARGAAVRDATRFMRLLS